MVKTKNNLNHIKIQHLFPHVGHAKVSLFNFNVGWTRLSEFFPLVGVLNVSPHACELVRDVKVAVLLGSDLKRLDREEQMGFKLRSHMAERQSL